MSSFRDTHHRYSLALTAVLAIILCILLIVLGTAEDADGRGQPPVGFTADPASGEVYATSPDGPVYRLEPLP